MKYDDFNERSPGILVPTVYDALAFVPNALPPELDLGKVALSLAKAMGKIGELKGACRRLQNPYLFISPLQRLEAQTSSAMEGTYTTAENLAYAEAGVKKIGDEVSIEVSNYIFALREAVEAIQDFPITHRMMKAAHKRLLEGVGRERGEDKSPGEFKRDQNMIGAKTLEKARFIPPPPSATPDCISKLEEFINADRDQELALIDLAYVHYQFETIHPFSDGNGRVGRMLISVMAVSKGLLELPALFLSPTLEGVKDEYIDKMYRVSAFGEWTEWLNFFLDAVARSASNAIETIDSIISLQAEYKTRASDASTSVNLHSVIDLLFESPVLRPKTIVEKIGITDAAARTLLTKLEKLGILIMVDSVYPRAWVALELIRLSSPKDS